MTAAAHAEAARRWFREVWGEGGEATVRELLAPAAVAHLEGHDAYGIDDFLRARAIFVDAFPDLAFGIEDLAADGDKVVVRWYAEATQRGAFLGIAASHRSVAFRGMTWLRFADGRIVEGWDAWNQGALLMQLQGPPPVAVDL